MAFLETVTRRPAGGYDDAALTIGSPRCDNAPTSKPKPAQSGGGALVELKSRLPRKADARAAGTSDDVRDRTREIEGFGAVDESAFEDVIQTVMSTSDILLPSGEPVGYVSGSAGRGIRTVAGDEFHRLHSELLNGAQVARTPSNYKGTWFKRIDGTLLGIRESADNGTTIDVIRSDDPGMPPGFKVHHA
jgi:hypothetical protein